MDTLEKVAVWEGVLWEAEEEVEEVLWEVEVE